MNKLHIAALAALMVSSIFAEEQIPLWPEGKMPVGTTKDAAVGEEHVSEKGIVKDVSVPAIEVFLPTNVTRSTIGIVICPGGAYGCLDFEHEGRRTARFLNSIGVAAFVLKYRVRPYPKGAALADLQRALSVVRANAKKWNVAKGHIGVMGYSAGGHLSVRSIAVNGKRVYEPVDATDEESALPSFAVLVYPAYLTKDGKVPADIEPAITSATPIFMIAGLADLYRGSGVGYFSAHVAKNRWPKIEAHFYPQGCHGFGVSTKPHNDVYKWERLLATWLRRRGQAIKAKIDASLDQPNYDPVELDEDGE
jgi:acetyl esterase/lipase